MPEQSLALLGVSVWGVNIADVGTLALIVIMVTMGLTLEMRDFARVFARPRAAVVGLGTQIVVLPAVAFALIYVLSPPLPIAAGLIILAACPSGATSNFFSYQAGGDVALSIALTAVSGTIVIFTLPVLVNLGLMWVAGEGAAIHLPVLASMLRIFELIVLPVIVGMALRRLRPRLAARIEPIASALSFAVILFTMAVLFAYIAGQFLAMLAASWKVTVGLNVIMMTLGFVGARRLGLGERQARAISIEIGVQNYMLSVVIAISLLGRPDFAVVPVIYLFTMYVSVFTFIAYCRFVRDRRAGICVPGVVGAGRLR